MESLLKWAILNSATANEDAPTRDPSQPAPKQQKLDPEIIDMILGKPASVQMTECLDATEHTSTPLPARIIALDDLEMLVENIDNAGNLGPLQLWPRLIKLYNDPEAEIRSHALWVSGTAVQHNPSAQKVFPGLAAALELLRADSDMGVRAKALYCVSSFVRANVAGLTKFVALNGLEAVLGAVQVGDVALAQKGFFLLRALIDEAMDEETPRS
ncbi:nucleotide exchange factor Fes1-domain-containing protein [Kickxella alabastrina]|uniref:nucleotide exchange factor Fes1-domain-containing protein n=1 Tax=Kickxella alabastrina TaxID=61397 RepID=UPI0022210299|nr:nucleotide exchange factor Fes1-domain-containing protein [Kickxella alabastrina]KAI7823143.1 nucleotide exchange factor Fes1-domain-containing protein [Kickxella alabastrina]